MGKFYEKQFNFLFDSKKKHFFLPTSAPILSDLVCGHLEDLWQLIFVAIESFDD